MRIHLYTPVGGHIDLLTPMIAHYQQQGVDEISVHVQLAGPYDPVADEARLAAQRAGCSIASFCVGDWQTHQVAMRGAAMQRHPDDWWILADQDEFQTYPDTLRSLLAFCDRHGYDYITGALVDRLSADGGFPAIDLERPLGPQFPLGAFLTWPLLGGDPRKTVAAKGRVPLVIGAHWALAGVPCPIEDAFVPVHHYKWTAGVIDRLRARAAALRRGGVAHWEESARFIEYYETHAGRIDVSDERFLVGPCTPDYPHWPAVRHRAVAYRDERAARHRERHPSTSPAGLSETGA
jgi:hypothetical protein